MEADYSQLPEDIVVKIAREHFETTSQLFSFSAVCKSWRSIALRPRNYRYGGSLPGLPGLLIADGESGEHEFSPVTMFHTSQPLPRVTIPLGPNLPTNNPEEDRMNNPCLASKDGWVLVIHPRPVRLHLLNPITRASIALPTLRPTLHDFHETSFNCQPSDFIVRAVISSSPDDHRKNCFVFVIFSRCINPRLAWCKVDPRGLLAWNFTSSIPRDVDICDAAFFGNKLHVLSDDSVYILDGPTAAVRKLPFSSAMSSLVYCDDEGDAYINTFLHLAHLNGHLLVILRNFAQDEYHYNHVTFHVFRLALQGRDGGGEVVEYCITSDYDWEEARSLEGHALFLGYSHESICLPAPSSSWGDRIYFAYSFYYGHYDPSYGDDFGPINWHRNDCGVFNLVDRKVECFARRNGHNQNYFWFFPMPWNICEHTKHQATNAENWRRLLLQTSANNTSRGKTQSRNKTIRRNNSNNINSASSTNNRTSNAPAMIRAKETVKKTNNKVQQQRQNNSKVGSNRFEALLLVEDADEDGP
ncbi:unnamed protein product [Linum trigynum]|uniref:F-box domain-containing protein n=1 Tax=Linum trigynum TaxID=586398 RepID=A0AAV2GB06_9ROSI